MTRGQEKDTIIFSFSENAGRKKEGRRKCAKQLHNASWCQKRSFLYIKISRVQQWKHKCAKKGKKYRIALWLALSSPLSTTIAAIAISRMRSRTVLLSATSLRRRRWASYAPQRSTWDVRPQDPHVREWSRNLTPHLLLQGSVLLLQHLPHSTLLSIGFGLLPDFRLQKLYSAVPVLVERLYGHEPAVPVSAALDLQTSKLLCGPGKLPLARLQLKLK